MSRSPVATAPAPLLAVRSTTEPLLLLLLLLEVVPAMAIRVKFAHCRMQLAVVRRVKFLVQLRMQTERGSLGAFDVLSTAAAPAIAAAVALRPVVPMRVRNPPRCKAERRAASTFISLRSRSCAEFSGATEGCRLLPAAVGRYVVGLSATTSAGRNRESIVSYVSYESICSCGG